LQDKQNVRAALQSTSLWLDENPDPTEDLCEEEITKLKVCLQIFFILLFLVLQILI